MKTRAFIATLLPIFLLASCSSNKSETADSAYSDVADTSAISGVTADSVKIIKTADVDLKVKDAYEVSRKITAAATALGGKITHHQLATELNQSKDLEITGDSLLTIYSYTTIGSITARVPNNGLEEFMDVIYKQAAFISNSTLDVEDKSLQYMESSMRQKSQDKILAKRNSKEGDDLSKDELISQHNNSIAQKIANKQIDIDARYSTVVIRLSQDPQIRKEKIANPNLSSYELPLQTRIGNAFSAGWEYFMVLALAVAHLWAFILLGVCAYVVYRFLKQRRTTVAVAK